MRMPIFVFVLAMTMPLRLFAQGYVLNGSATQVNATLRFRLTPDVEFKDGSVWNKTQLDLTSDFDFEFKLFFGTTDPSRGDLGGIGQLAPRDDHQVRRGREANVEIITRFGLAGPSPVHPGGFEGITIVAQRAAGDSHAGFLKHFVRKAVSIPRT